MPKKVMVEVFLTRVDERGVSEVEQWILGDNYTEASAGLLRTRLSECVQEFDDEMFRCQLRNEHPTDPRASAGGFDVIEWGDFAIRM